MQQLDGQLPAKAGPDGGAGVQLALQRIKRARQ